MVEISNDRLLSLKQNFDGKKIAVIGDMMLDGYYWGDVKRISPEAPVPVLEIENEFFRFGGAANCALNLLKLGAVPIPIGIIGYDSNGSIFKSLLQENGIEEEGIITDEERPTTTKTRVIANNQHVVRIDKESKSFLDKNTEMKILNYLKSKATDLDGVILQDYNKGVLTPSLIINIIEFANKNDILITVDPKFDNFFSYKNVTVFKPNRKETENVFGIRIRSKEEIVLAGESLLEKMNAKYILLTLGEDGLAVFSNEEKIRRMPTKARKVADVSGAGDTVISTLTLAMAAGANIYEACYLSNYAAGIVCGEVGIVPIEKDVLFETVLKDKR
jgi:D-glycero-beta-D-manno-heptose-7-phosphate kinase